MSLAAILLVVGLNDGMGYVSSFGSSVAQSSSEDVERKPASTPLSAVAAMPAETTVAPEVATIISEPVKEKDARDTQGSELIAAEPEGRPAVPQEINGAADGAMGTVAETTNITLEPKADSHIKAGSVAATSKAVRDQSDSSRRTQAKSKLAQATAPEKNRGKDEDVDLIAALLSRVSSTPKTSAKEGPNKATSAATASRKISSSSVAKQERNQGGNRDIVVKAPEESIESLVKRCRALGFFEGELCRLRICSGMWDKNPACATNNQDLPI